MEFKQFLLTEQKNYLAERIGDLLTGIHELVAGGKQIGTRQLIRHSDNLVNEIRKILHTTWPRSEHKHLKVLQKCGVAIAKCVDERGDLKGVLNSSRNELEKLSQKLGVPVNNLGSSNATEST